jgi:hypothetical protein
MFEKETGADLEEVLPGVLERTAEAAAGRPGDLTMLDEFCSLLRGERAQRMPVSMEISRVVTLPAVMVTAAGRPLENWMPASLSLTS